MTEEDGVLTALAITAVVAIGLVLFAVFGLEMNGVTVTL